LVDGKRVPGDNDLVVGLEEGVADELDDFARSVAEDDVFAFQVELLRDGLAQVISAAVGVDVGG
jgi:hypothetical protein